MRHLLFCAAFVALAACGGAEPVWAPDDQVARARYVSTEPASITLFTVTRVTDGSGAHSGLLINGSQVVMFDPAGSWHHPALPERNDVHFGVTPKVVAYYIDYHARETFDVHEQTLRVPPAVAETVLQRALAYGAVPKANCARAISTILHGTPGLEQVDVTWFPNRLREEFGQLPGATSRTIHDDDADDNHGVLIVQHGDPRLN
ncbi:hypothetical protein [Cereibacter sphaeroides]|jgi:hypothetical protein|uniref:Lipoprotein n=1 Tax=Cereibacter sphaeroides TaxID=1063 RepID=A0AAX1URC7_CERSP|nr:hypothetical protein [Cereibacter sphaeroides]ABN77497.1 hypothetical protein Rsph17029_2395 [Cereibacter sphaeroides ATCC 17029]EKX59401.1 hypothetical protein D516_2556 [Rhodobacter sp. AKP1]AZB54485.1 hypothetical protein EBL89_03785 [Cereibacter sphaeroides]AZB58759.1 hypothetical protein EBL88_03870 [Cereibacter sphaeroides]EGJ22231.1 hypothetical protein RSWS8N_09115 [Cereibacter sphaeroides WS8N]